MSYAALAIGALFAVVGALLIIKQFKSERKNTQSVIATVERYHTEVSHSARSGSSIVYYPVMKYYASGQYYEEKTPSGSGKRKYEIGEEVEIMCDPDRPEMFIVAGDKSMYIAGAVTMAMGLIVCVLQFVS